MNPPQFSIITVCLNAADTIRTCLDSVAEQSVRLEHLVMDGGSTDGTVDIVRSIDSESLRLTSEPDAGMYDAMNKGIDLATGEIVGILNSDDFYAAPDVLATVEKIFENPDIDACYGDLNYVDRNHLNREIRYWHAGEFNAQKFYAGWMPPHPTFFVRRRVYERYGVFNMDLGSAADYELMLRFLLKHKLRAAYVPQLLVTMRTGGVSNASLKNRLAANMKDRQAWTVNGLKPHLWTLWLKPLRKLGQWHILPTRRIEQE